MNYKKILKSMKNSIFLAASLVMISSTVHAVVDLAAVEGTWTSSSTGEVVTMWGFVEDTTDVCPDPTTTAWDLGPTLTEGDLDGANLTISLRNCLPDPVSIVIPGQTQEYFEPERNAEGRIVALTQEAPADNGLTTTSFTWLNVNLPENAGTFLYQSGSHAAKQVHMGLYGVLKVGTYPGTSREVTLVYSEIDPNLHASAAAATPLGYKPSYFLLNGQEQAEPILVGDLLAPTALNFLNAGLDFHVPALGGDYFEIIAEDGNEYPYAKQQYSVNLAAGKTKDAIWTPTASGEYPLFDRRGHGMPVKLVVVNDVTQPFAQDDHYGFVNNHGWVNPPAIVQDQISVSLMEGLLANDYPVPPAVQPIVDPVVLVSGPDQGILECVSSTGTINPGLCPDGSFIYTPNVPGFDGPDTFVYNITGSPSQGTVTIDVNAGPVAEDLDTAVWRKSKPGKKDKGDLKGTDRNTINLLDYVSDPSRVDAASFEIIGMKKKKNGKWKLFKTANKGVVKNKKGGRVTYKPKKTFVGLDSFTYIVRDVQGAVSNVGTVNINVVKKLADLPPLI